MLFALCKANSVLTGTANNTVAAITCIGKQKQIMSKSPRAKETPAQKIKRLERELEDEQLKNRLLNTVVDIMDEEYGAGLRKKYIAKERDAFKLKKKLV